ncbi:MoaA/NifB/PqqE/SkfB family radical SAM enzyme [Clostridium acetobutylicum]|uniref:AstB/chuR/nirj-related protein n=1 Tax=Clostridium acetobutylicum (strain ATCC 824 / DSM 792 / JCM 1419 / IAM 19013 / LMG 5710 / NBRC 13948 / NRRL B-527 / VKM B-1787 / 2291 / W) TaxID=272562 RepID=Q97TG5_CLOAB|nr:MULTISPECIES: radical SAM protein [Clostridium]AAK76881.1 AstB/chuR/nirj-related protein [Clostridium acetobutylicum ATCC 824]ADZ22918.1 AstB/chuR/nirj-related protein [Clostridium acetobutylicum EA 2018]AEI34877.1 AstB/chuR/nirj-related protein [Clostridium acetobutylicum DSM 1731]AWV82423.1 radical SAM protein [Clostridium acetobutylicum]MBC2395733.1 radical SAM protein [Clostridium acetobutylicum]
MQPKTRVSYEAKDLNTLKRTIRNISVPLKERKNNPRYATKLPDIVGIKITNNCNLRCKHCYEWGKKGYHMNMDKEEQQRDIDLKLFEKILNETKELKSRLYLWGGEPLCHKQFDKIADMLVQDPREIAICTNTLMFDNNLDSLIKISDNLELLIPIEGFEEAHDLIRGKGNFKKVVESVKLLIDLKRKGIYKGKISIHSVINDNICDRLYELVEFFEGLGVDMVFLAYPWYISEETACKMDKYFKDNFYWLEEANKKKNKSWHCFKYKISPESLENLKEQVKKVCSKVWNIRVRFQPDLDIEDIKSFVFGAEVESLKCRNCLAVSTRMDILADGSVSSCKYFSEFTIGNIKDGSISEIWHSEQYGRIREVVNSGISPICSKCNLLYLNGK